MEDSQQLAEKTVKSTIWIYISFAASKGLTFISSIILARILAPDDFGLLSLGLLAINYLDVLNELGVGPALIYQQGDVEKKANVAFTFSLTINAVLTLIAFLGAPLVAWFFNEPRIVPIVQILSFSFVLSSLGNIHATRLKKEMNFRKNFIPDIGRTFTKGAISIVLALLGFGVWSLVIGQLAGVLISNILYWTVLHWRPILSFDWKIGRSLLGYGSQMILVDLMGMINQNIDYLIIGRRLDSNQLGYYTIAFRIPELVIMNICYVVSKALFPAYSKIQNNQAALQQGFLVALRYVSLITVPIGVGLALLSSEFIDVFYSAKWAESIPVMQLLSLYAAVYSLSFNSGDIYKAIGKPWILNAMAVVKLAITVPVLWFAAGFNIFYVAVGQLIAKTILTLLELAILNVTIAIHPYQIIKTLFPVMVSTLVMLVGTYFLKMEMITAPSLLRLVVVPVVGVVIYISTLWLTQRELVLSSVKMARTIVKA